MSIVVNNAIVLSQLVDDEFNFAPAIGWDNKVKFGNVSGAPSQTGYPLNNMTNGNTGEVWKSSSLDEQNIVVDFPLAQIDYIGVARHNLSSIQSRVTVLAKIDGDWIMVFNQAILSSDKPAMLVFNPVFCTAIRINIAGSLGFPSIGVLYAGKLIRPMRGIQAGFVPLEFADQVDLVNDRSESGEFFGSIVTNRRIINTASFRYVNYAWFRQYMGDFIKSIGAGTPFFFAWEPNEYPNDVGFVKVTSSIMPTLEMVAQGYNCHFDLPMEALTL